MNGQFNPTFRNARSGGQLGVNLSELLNYTPPKLSTNYFTSQNPQPISQQSTWSAAGYQTPPFQQPQTTGNQTSLSLANIFNTSSGLASQLIAAFGKNPNQQITGSSQVQALVAPQQTTYGTGGISPQQQALLVAQQQLQQGGTGAGVNAYNAGTGILDSIAASFNISTTTLLIGGVAAALLLFKQPPSRR